MITWILGTILIIFCLIKRFSKEGRVEGQPLGMPQGTVRAIITLMIVAFPFTYIIINAEIPSEIVNSIFILVAFYYEARKSEDNRLTLIHEIKKPEKAAEEKKKAKKPLYLPKYSVRILILSLLVIFFIIDQFRHISLELTNTLIDILIIAALYFIGTFFSLIGDAIQKKKLKRQIVAIPNFQDLSKYDISEKLNEQKRGSAINFSKSLFSIIIFLAVTFALALFTFDIDYTLVFNISLRRALLLLINIYYGFRD
ncbi:MAG: hypothetical protein EAX89_12905 [Candidatus Lokiarchaeota archaeon]|nr:hypothetical protein [Candidatus Lokiarchaeota archaeon]